MSTSDTGETAAQHAARISDKAWPDIKGALKAGAVLRRPMGMKDYYTVGLEPGDRRNGRCLFASRVKKLEQAGTLVRVGVDTYRLGDDQ